MGLYQLLLLLWLVYFKNVKSKFDDAQGTALGCMVGQLSYGKKKWEDVEEVMRKNLPIIYDVTMRLITLIDRDTEAFNAFFKALKMPQGTKEEKQL